MKIKLLFASLVMALTVAFTATLAGCTLFSHTHTSAIGWGQDETSHWKYCEECGEVMDKADHTYNAPKHYDATTYDNEYTEEYCTICNYKKVTKIEGTRLGQSHDKAIEAEDQMRGKLKEGYTYYFKIPASSSKFFDLSNTYGDSSKITVSFKFYTMENGTENVLKEEKNYTYFGPQDPLPDGTIVAYGSYCIHKNVSSGTFYLTLTAPKDLSFSFSIN